MSRALSGPRAAVILARLSVKRLVRSRVLWISALVAVAPLLVQLAAGGAASLKDEWRDLYSVLTVALAIIPALHLATAIAEEIEDRTFTYLWSRPFPRWALLCGKLMALVPMAATLVMLSVALSFAIAFGGDSGQSLGLLGDGLAAAALGVVAMSCTAMGIGSLVYKHATAASLAYLLALDTAVGAMPFSIQNLSMSFHVRSIALADLGLLRDTSGDPWFSALWLCGLSALWIAIAVWRITRTEYATDK